ncbi:hypothetical protein KJ764_03280 [Patescibacteria group bacterium]|nr:hypothetical protein [Patescibacteria group bacterium]
MTNKTCKNCSRNFEIADSDQAFYQKIQVPKPTHCPTCRFQRRLANRNERCLFKRKCDMCQKEVVSTFNSDAPFPVYCPECWWSDKWDPADYGQDFDFGRPFFEQFYELMQKVPKATLLQLNNENCPYNSYMAFSKNSYMSPGSYCMEDCIYSRKSQYCKDCINNTLIDHCELVAYSVNCKDSYNSHHLVNCRTCTDCGYMTDSYSCQKCFMCAGIHNKKFNIKNHQYSSEEYKERIIEYMKRDPKELAKEFQEFSVTVPKRHQNQLNCEKSSGDCIQSCKNAVDCYDCFDIEDCKYLVECVNVKDSMDLSMHDKDIELCYELSTGGESNKNLKFAYCTAASPNSEYLYSCFYLADSFGCDGFHSRTKNFIFNKKYSEEDYKTLKAKIIEHMEKTGEYGEFFPIQISPYPYNQTLAQDYFPLTQEQALAKGYRWEDMPQAPHREGDDVLACEDCGKSYMVISQELKLYDKMGLEAPKDCPECRYKKLIAIKNPRYLWTRNCAKCNTGIQTTYAPDRSETVYCKKCYLETV